ncbi:MAG: hypothetical protein AAFQ94_17475 [Bacteroidota bacterium]
MTGYQRKRHLIIWLAIGLLLPLLFAYGYYNNRKQVDHKTQTEVNP